MAQTRDKKRKLLQFAQVPLHNVCFNHCEHTLCDTERVTPVVISHWSIILLDTQDHRHNTRSGIRNSSTAPIWCIMCITHRVVSGIGMETASNENKDIVFTSATFSDSGR
eukprot:m.201103 g.201103  ORF g.201103 m.201103 type:complete len:110 (+) comp13715_c0_seq3:1218-1547(+)